ncbi:MAG: hypothetical protein ACYCW6_31640, partial [Candidatus Xenobia bacterium]
MEGRGTTPTINAVLRVDVPTCRRHDRCDAVLLRLTGDVCVVVSEERVVLGQVSRARLQATGNTLVERVMEPGPT